MTEALTRRRLIGGAAGLSLAPLATGCARAAQGETGAFHLKTPLLRGEGLRVAYFVPPSAHRDSEIVVVMHGRGRDAGDYRDAWIGPAKAAGAVVLAPEFDEEPFGGSREYNQGWVQEEDGDWRPPRLWSFSLVEQAFDAFVARTGSRQAGYSLYGHSAGAQFVHRFMLFMPARRVAQAVAANAGWYTLPSFEAPYPYGLADSPPGREALAAYLAKPLTVLLGGEDDDPDDEALRQTALAMAQGPHRFARGRTFFETGRRAAERLGVPFNWRLQVARGVAHDNAAMSRAAAQLMLG